MLNFSIFFAVLMYAAVGSASASNGKEVSFCTDDSLPKHAFENRHATPLFIYCPRLEDISLGRDITHKLFSGQWFDKRRPTLDFYSQTIEGLNISLGGSVSTANMNSQKGSLPLLSGKRGFYIEFMARIDGGSMDHWPALWLNPIEHGAREEDRNFVPGKLYQHWMELDVDEGGFQDGMLGTVIEWYGNYPKYQKIQGRHPPAKKLDRTKFHVFSALYDPVTASIQWWIDGEFHNVLPAPKIASHYNYYVIMNSQSHGANEPFKLIVKRVRAFELY